MLQEAAETHPTLRAHRIGIGLYDLVDGTLTRRTSLEIDITGAEHAPCLTSSVYGSPTCCC